MCGVSCGTVRAAIERSAVGGAADPVTDTSGLEQEAAAPRFQEEPFRFACALRQTLPTTQWNFPDFPVRRRRWPCIPGRTAPPARATFRRTHPMSARSAAALAVYSE
jgi:hypothetical protein